MLNQISEFPILKLMDHKNRKVFSGFNLDKILVFRNFCYDNYYRTLNYNKS